MALQELPNSMLEQLNTLILPVGTLLPFFGSAAPSGGFWLLWNTDTIGSAASAATHADDDYETFFTHLYGTYNDTECPVTGGRGASAAADWAADKPVSLPLLFGRSPIFAGNGPDLGDGEDLTARTYGDVGGSEDHTIALANLPSTLYFADAAPTSDLQTGPSAGKWDITAVQGSDTAIDHMSPFFVMNGLIRAK